MILYDKDGPYLQWSPGAKLDVSFDWSAWLANEGEAAIATSTWTTPAGFSQLAATNSDGITAVLFDTADVTIGTVETINTITAGSKQDSRRWRIKIKQN